MKIYFLIAVTLISSISFAQENNDILKKEKGRKGQFYIYWGWHEGVYSKSDITFKGENYNFTLYDVVAKDRQEKFSANKHLDLGEMTKPQYNFRIGYFFHDKYNISFGIDHMKYIVRNDQTATINGNINTGTVYDGTYNNQPIAVTKDFLKFEHTDGLNYANIEVRRFDKLFDLNKVTINLTEGLGAGILYPKTKTTLFGQERYDEFHLSGYGAGAVVGLNVEFFEHFFIQGELKGGYINMPNIRTTQSTADSASQDFFFAQAALVFGGIWHF